MRKIIILLALTVLIVLPSCAVKEYDDNFYFRAGGIDVAPGMRAEDALDYLGDARSINSSPSCAFDGEERIYSYSGYDVYTEWEDGKEVISRVVLTSDAVSTERGIRIGDSFHDVVVAYGRNYEKKGENIEYDGERCDVQFFFSDGIVTAIKYLADD